MASSGDQSHSASSPLKEQQEEFVDVSSSERFDIHAFDSPSARRSLRKRAAPSPPQPYTDENRRPAKRRQVSKKGKEKVEDDEPAVVWSSHQRHLKLGLLRTKKPYFTRGPMSLSDLLKKNPLALDDSLLRLICHLGW